MFAFIGKKKIFDSRKGDLIESFSMYLPMVLITFYFK